MLIGQRFKRLIVLEFSHKDGKNAFYKCRCDCGNETTVRKSNLGATGSCGCLHKGGNSFHKKWCITKQQERTRNCWWSMIQRCHGKGHQSQKYYKDRGITVCDRWRYGENGKTGRECFIEDMGLFPDGLSIDRINNDGNYEPGNCRWATPKEQQANTRRIRKPPG